MQDIEGINSSNKQLFNAIVYGKLYGIHGASPLSAPSHGWIDVRDAAELHVRGLEYPAAADQRTLILSSQFVWQDASMLIKRYLLDYQTDSSISYSRWCKLPYPLSLAVA